jgi:pectin methylesterase-like acyl-CoA thioesterase
LTGLIFYRKFFREGQGDAKIIMQQALTNSLSKIGLSIMAFIRLISELITKNQTTELCGNQDWQLPLGVWPPDDTTEVCVDTCLKITFDAPPRVGNSGTVKICRASDDTVVDRIDLADQPVDFAGIIPPLGTTSRLNVIGYTGGATQARVVNYYPVLQNGNTITIVPHNNKLSYNEIYYVTIDSGVLTGKIYGRSFNGIPKAAWQFQTKRKAPSGTTLRVDGYRTADFCTVQGALDQIPAGNTLPYVINIADGVYEELLYIGNKYNITLRGQNRAHTIIQYDNYESFNAGNGSISEIHGHLGISSKAGASTGAPISDIIPDQGGRAVLVVNRGDGLVLDNLTLRNKHVQNAAAYNQAETIYLSGDEKHRCVVKNCNLISCQDTVQCKVKTWFYNCLITGDVDFIGGCSKMALFENCEIRSRHNPKCVGYIAQTRVSPGNKGFVFLNCTLTKEPQTSGNYLARSCRTSVRGQTTQDENCDNVAYIKCKIGDHILPVGWHYYEGSPTGTIQPSGPNPAVASAQNGWKEYQNTDLDGDLLDISQRLVPGSCQLTTAEYEAGYQDRATIFGDWNPIP